MMNYYVYAYLRQSDNTPYYIGKGKGNRAFKGRHSVSIPKDKSKIVILETNLTEIGSLALERRMIRWYGRKDLDTGILHNRTDGGDGVAGKKFSKEERLARAARFMGNQIAKNTIYTQDMRDARAKRAIGNKNAVGGKSKSGLIPSTQQRLLNSLKHTGKLWWTDGSINKKLEVCPGTGWHRGRTSKK